MALPESAKTLARTPEELAHVFPGLPEVARRRQYHVGEGFTLMETGLGFEAFGRRHPDPGELGIDAQWLYKLAFHGWSYLVSLVFRGMDRAWHLQLAIQCAV